MPTATPDHKMTVAGQYLDSINVPGNLFITALWAPVGLRYHATHHLFPQMPYHNLGKAHRILVNNLSTMRFIWKPPAPACGTRCGGYGTKRQQRAVTEAWLYRKPAT